MADAIMNEREPNSKDSTRRPAPNKRKALQYNECGKRGGCDAAKCWFHLSERSQHLFDHMEAQNGIGFEWNNSNGALDAERAQSYALDSVNELETPSW